MESITKYIEGTLKLTINKEKSSVSRLWPQSYNKFHNYIYKIIPPLNYNLILKEGRKMIGVAMYITIKSLWERCQKKGLIDKPFTK